MITGVFSHLNTGGKRRQVFVLTGTVLLAGGGWQQRVVVWQRLGVEHVQARDQRGRRAVHSLLLGRLHAVGGVQEGRGGVSARTQPTISNKRLDSERK